MDFHPAGSRPTRVAPSEYFTGNVMQDPIIATAAPARLVANSVSFQPGREPLGTPIRSARRYT